MSKCPKCGKRHIAFPRKCFYDVHADHVHVVIARVASGSDDQRAWAKEVEEAWGKMRKYAEENGWYEKIQW